MTDTKHPHRHPYVQHVADGLQVESGHLITVSGAETLHDTPSWIQK